MKKLIILAIAMFTLTGCASLKKDSGGFFQRLSKERNLAKAVNLFEEGNEAAASRLLAEITSAKGIAGVTDEALFRLSLMHLRPDIEKDYIEQSQKRLERLRKEYPASSWTRMAWPLMEFVTSVEELRRHNRNLKILNLSLNKDNKELQSLKSLNLTLTRENKELRQSIESLKHLDLELEQKTRH